MWKLILSTFFLVCGWANAQNSWIKRAGGAGTDLANGLWVDESRNVFVTGSIGGQAKFYKAEVLSRGGGDVYITKFNSDGVPIWIRTFGGKLDDFANAICGDPEGNLYIAGVFTDTAYFEKKTLISKGSDVFILKLNPKGDMIWVKSLETLGSALPECIAVTDQGGVYVGGLFSGQLDEINKRQMGQTDGFVTKLDWQGNLSWTKIFGGPGFDEVTMLSTDPWGRVLVGGNYDQLMFADEQELVGSSSKSSFAIRIEATGSILWAKSFSGSDAQSQISDATTDLEGTVYLTGKFSGETHFGSDAKVSKGQTDVFLMAIKTDGAIQWVRTLGGDNVDEGLSIHLSQDKSSIYLGGLFNKHLESGKKSLRGDYDNQVFLSRWDKRGNLDLLRKEEFNSSFQCSGRGLDSKGNFWLCGSFTDKSDFGKQNLKSAGEEDLFITAISDSKVSR